MKRPSILITVFSITVWLAASPGSYAQRLDADETRSVRRDDSGHPDAVVWSYTLEPQVEPYRDHVTASPAPPTTAVMPEGEVAVNYASSLFWSGNQAVDFEGDYTYCVLAFGPIIFVIADPTASPNVSQLYTHGSAEDIKMVGPIVAGRVRRI